MTASIFTFIGQVPDNFFVSTFAQNRAAVRQYIKKKELYSEQRTTEIESLLGEREKTNQLKTRPNSLLSTRHGFLNLLPPPWWILWQLWTPGKIKKNPKQFVKIISKIKSLQSRKINKQNGKSGRTRKKKT